MPRKVAFALAALLLIAFASPAHAERVRLSANLDGTKEIPPVESGGTATATVWFDKDTGTVTWDVYWSGLSGAPTAAHFHGPASRYAKAGVQVDIAALKPEASITLVTFKHWTNMQRIMAYSLQPGPGVRGIQLQSD